MRRASRTAAYTRFGAVVTLVAALGCARPGPSPVPPPEPAPATPRSELVIRVLDVGQGDATLITNGRSTVLVDGGPDARQLGEHLDRLGLGHDTTIDVVVLSHAHGDHYLGLRALFASTRRLRVGRFIENRDSSPNTTLAQLRDSIMARVRLGQTSYVDSDDPCGDGSSVCRIALGGGAHLEVLRPDPAARDANDRSTAVKLVAADSTFAMWFAGDAERAAIAWFDTTDYDRQPGMRVDVLKADHHGSCNGVTAEYLALLQPTRVVVSLGATNTYGHMHVQAKDAFRAAGVPWYRTDRNGTVTIRVPATDGARFSVTPERAGESLDGAADRASTAAECRVGR